MNNSRIPRSKNVKFSEYYFYLNTNIWGDFQISISVPLSLTLMHRTNDFFQKWLIIKSSLQCLLLMISSSYITGSLTCLLPCVYSTSRTLCITPFCVFLASCITCSTCSTSFKTFEIDNLTIKRSVQ